MKNFSKLMTITFAVVLAFCSANNAAISSPANFKYAVVDVPKVVASSKQVTALKNEQNAKLRELSQFVQNANKQLQSETDAQKKQALEKKLNTEFASKKAAVEKNYAAKLEAIDKSISSVIAQKAKAKGFDLVLAKGVVLYATEGTDITNEIMQSVK